MEVLLSVSYFARDWPRLQRYLDLLNEQLSVAGDIQRQLRMPAPWQRKAKVVSISQGQARA